MTAGWLSADAGFPCEADSDVLLEVAAEAFGVSVDDLVGLSRTQELVRFRHISMAAVRSYTGMSFPRLGDLFERDHTTVMYACSKVDKSYGRARDRLVDAMRRRVESPT